MPQWQDAAEVRRATRSETSARRSRDVDTIRRFQVLKIFSWSSLGGVVGGLLGVYGQVQGVWGWSMVLGFAAFGWVVSFVFPLLVSSLTGRAARVLSTPSGSSTPHKQGYSQAESLAARGMFEDGIAAFEAAIAKDGRDPIPYLQIARIYRDRMRRFDDSAHWFKRALKDAHMPAGTARLTRRELVELYTVKMREPAKAAPLLARTAEEHAGSEEGDWAARELASIRSQIAGEAGPQ